jgi:hypothetical protein
MFAESSTAEWAAVIVAIVVAVGTFVGFLIKHHWDQKAKRENDAKAAAAAAEQAEKNRIATEQKQAEADQKARARANEVQAGVDVNTRWPMKGQDEFSFWIFNPEGSPIRDIRARVRRIAKPDLVATFDTIDSVHKFVERKFGSIVTGETQHTQAKDWQLEFDFLDVDDVRWSKCGSDPIVKVEAKRPAPRSET